MIFSIHQLILDLTRKQESVQREHYVLDMSLDQLRSVLTEQEHRRGRAFYEGEPIQSQSATMLVRVVEKCIQEMAMELDQKNKTVMQVSGSKYELLSNHSLMHNELV